MSLNSRPMIFDHLPFYPWWTRSVSVVRTHIHGSKEEGCRWDWYLDARNRWISGSRTIPGVLQCSGTLKTSRDNGAEWATAAWHAALPRASLSLSLYLSIHPSIRLSLFLRWRSTGQSERRVHCWTSEVLMENFSECIHAMGIFNQAVSKYLWRLFIYYCTSLDDIFDYFSLLLNFEPRE